MAGVTRPELYRILSILSYLEVDRMGPRPSLRSRNILQIVEKLAAAGIRGPDVEAVYELAAKLLDLKDDRPDSETIDALRTTKENAGTRTFGVHSTRSLLWLWRVATRQSKAKAITTKESEQTTSAAHIILTDTGKRDDWVERFHDPHRPLVVDVGCGMGVSLLRLSGYSHQEECSSKSPLGPLSINFSDCNFVGGDLKSLLVGYSSGIATR